MRAKAELRHGIRVLAVGHLPRKPELTVTGKRVKHSPVSCACRTLLLLIVGYFSYHKNTFTASWLRPNGRMQAGVEPNSTPIM